jgi:hypothetical protein
MEKVKTSEIEGLTMAGNTPGEGNKTVTVGSGRTEVRLDLAPRGRDWLLLIGGGEAHVGAVAVAWPDGISLVTVPGHKEGPLAEKCALAVSRASGVVCTAVAGIHQDRATRAEIQDILTNVDRGLGEILAEAFPDSLSASGEGS